MEEKNNFSYGSSQLNELLSALSKAQGEFRCAPLDKYNSFFKSHYATHDSIIKTVREPLSKNGLCITQIITCIEDKDYLITTLGHSSGQFMMSKCRLNTYKTDQEFGRHLSYLKRYAYTSILGISTGYDDDDDGNSNMLIDESQLTQIKQLINGNKSLMENVLKIAKIKDLKDMPKDKYEGIIKWINKVNGKEHHENN